MKNLIITHVPDEISPEEVYPKIYAYLPRGLHKEDALCTIKNARQYDGFHLYIESACLSYSSIDWLYEYGQKEKEGKYPQIRYSELTDITPKYLRRPSV